MTIAEWRLLATTGLLARNVDSIAARIDAEVLLAHVLNRSRTWLFAHADEPLDENARTQLDALVIRRNEGEPLAYLVGYREFRSHEYRVGPSVLVPRDDTETLVDAALHATHETLERGSRCRILEAGTGSGIIAISLAMELADPRVTITASDIDERALQLARENATARGADIDFLQGDWLSAIAGQCMDIVVSNPPYIACDDIHLAELQREPRHALVSGTDGLDALRRLVADGTRVLSDNGILLVEHGYEQGPDVNRLLDAAGYSMIEHHRDLAGHLRVTTGRMRR